MTQVGWAFLIAAVLSLCAAAGLSCASAPKRLTHSTPFLVCHEKCMTEGAAEAVFVEKFEGMACVCVKAPDKT